MSNSARLLSLSLSASLVALMAAPAGAQMRTTAPQAQATTTAPTLSAFRRSGLEVRLFGGAQWQLGNITGYGSVASTNTGSVTTTQNPAGGAAGAGVPATSNGTNNPGGSVLTSPISSTSAAIPGMGLSFGGDFSYWLNDTFGLSLGYQWMGNSASTTASGRLPSSTPPGVALATSSLTPAASGSTITATVAASSSTLTWAQMPSGTWTVSMDNNPIVQTVNGGGAQTTNRAALSVAGVLPSALNFTPARTTTITGGPSVNTTTGTTAFSPATNVFLTTGAIPDNPNAAAGATPTTTYSADARVDFKGSDDRALSAWDLLAKTVLFDNGRTELTFLSGLTAPTMWAKQTSTVALTNAAGDGAATQTVTRTDPATGNGNTNFTETTTVSYAATSSIDASATMYGPMFGLGARAMVLPSLMVYSRFGWSPLLIGTGAYNAATAAKGSRTATLSNVGGTAPAGFGSTAGATFVNGTQTANEVNTANANQGSLPMVMVNASGASTLAVIGARYGLTPNVGVFVEGTARSFSGGASGSAPGGSPSFASFSLTSTYTGLNLGASLTF